MPQAQQRIDPGWPAHHGAQADAHAQSTMRAHIQAQMHSQNFGGPGARPSYYGGPGHAQQNAAHPAAIPPGYQRAPNPHMAARARGAPIPGAVAGPMAHHPHMAAGQVPVANLNGAARPGAPVAMHGGAPTYLDSQHRQHDPRFVGGAHRAADGTVPHGAIPPGAMTPQHAQAQEMSSRIASANTAISAIQSVTPPVIPPVPNNRPLMSLMGLPQLPGGDLKGTVKFDSSESVQVVDEVTAQRSAADFSAYLGKKRRERSEEWDVFWRHRLDLNRRILVEENECFKEAQEESASYEYSDDEDAARRIRPVTVPYIYHNIGSFDVPPPRPVIMPDPKVVILRFQAQEAQAAREAQQQQHMHQGHPHHPHPHMYQHPQHHPGAAAAAADAAQMQQNHLYRQQALSARQRAVQNVKAMPRQY